ncbi:glycine N-methyltransferase isoform X2 [Lingula anatina]|uniref:Glycine N-methyltransferase n=1 Tax=Lingula anatina TaxID=7574 RepID=A0A1S3IUX3_LINAN|nr:glycine N-methyltransferase isoform X1 [Lingula anatina]XP_013401874.1 glycine N-methyltransferase isoform X2 [Lingula anatina]|eukprot:XP_013401873.1 glycine N-methyltransferase isoform X1 [Lingula anatina]
MVDSIYRTRSLGVPAEGLSDQYADGKAARVWQLYIGCKQQRTSQYSEWLCNLLRKKGCSSVLDVACGTGVDSILLLEEGFKVTSVDASDKMLKFALKERWNRRKEEAFDNWVVEEANWLTLAEDFEEIPHPEGGFDTVICLGNSFAHLPDFSEEQREHRIAFSNFYRMVKPGGILIIDHRNYDAILDTGSAPAKNIYYNSDYIKDIKTSNLYVNGKPKMVTLDYFMDVSSLTKDNPDKEFQTHFRLSYYPHRLKAFTGLLKEAFGEKAEHQVFGDFREYDPEDTPAYFIHVIQRPFDE